MTNDETKPKKPRAKRTKEAIAADKRAWLLRHEWAGPMDACASVELMRDDLEAAHAAAADKIDTELWKAAQAALEAIVSALDAAIPPEART